VFKNRVLGRTFGPKKEAREDCIMRRIISRRKNGRGIYHTQEI
jgi:hypothetical protein